MKGLWLSVGASKDVAGAKKKRQGLNVSPINRNV
jgi:hypothetical protein